jgi:hypothetical protein
MGLKPVLSTAYRSKKLDLNKENAENERGRKYQKSKSLYHTYGNSFSQKYK